MNGIIGPQYLIAAGAAYSAKVRGTKQVAMAFGGDGSVNNGWYYSGLRNAALYNLPVVAVIENNGYQINMPQERTNALRDLSNFGAGLQIPHETVNGMDVMAVYAVAKRAVDRARAGGGPSLIEAKTYRFYDHSGLAGAKPGVLGAFGLPYRTDSEVRAWIAEDPIPKFRRQLVANSVLTEEEADKIEADVKALVAESIELARAATQASPRRGPRACLRRHEGVPQPVPRLSLLRQIQSFSGALTTMAIKNGLFAALEALQFEMRRTRPSTHLYEYGRPTARKPDRQGHRHLQGVRRTRGRQTGLRSTRSGSSGPVLVWR